MDDQGTTGAGRDTDYFARQLSDLDFNDRLLDLVADTALPLLERVKFLILFSERIDEFFQVQVAGLRRQVAAGMTSRALNGSTPDELLRQVRSSLETMVARQEGLFAEVLAPALAAEGISVVDWEDLADSDRAHLHEVFDRLILPVVTPLTVDPSHPFPYISNLSLNIGVEVRNRTDGTTRFARVKVPPNVDRLLALPDGTRFVPLEQVMVAFLDELFPGMEVGRPCIFRVTRDADLALDDDAADDLLLALQEELRRRRFLPVVRLEVDTRMSGAHTEVLADEFGLGPDDVYRYAGPLGLDCLWALYAIARPDLHDEPWNPLVPAAFTSVERDEDEDIFAVLARGDVLVHHPYESFSASVEELLNEAAEDPHVLAIKQCLYRTSGDSPIVAALVRAAELGKQVAALVEVTARCSGGKAQSITLRNVPAFAERLQAKGYPGAPSLDALNAAGMAPEPPRLPAAKDAHPDANADAALAEYYTHLSTIIRGPIWSAERWREIFAMNLGRYDHLIDVDLYRFPGLLVRKLAEVAHAPPKPKGVTALQDAGIPAGRVMNERDIFEDPHIRERGFFVPLTLPEAGTHVGVSAPLTMSVAVLARPESARKAGSARVRKPWPTRASMVPPAGRFQAPCSATLARMPPSSRSTPVKSKPGS